MECLKDSTVSQAIKTNFYELLERRMKCKACAEPFAGEMNFAPLFNLGFLTIKIETHDFGGYWAHIIFKESPMRIYRLWLYPIEKTIYQLRDISTMIPDAEMKKMMVQLSGKKYARYWIQPIKKYPIDALLAIVRPK